MKRPTMLLLVVVLLALAPALYAHADSRSAEVRYAVSATVIYVDSDTKTIQKVPVGSALREPRPKGQQEFIGWKDMETGALWDFSQPVTGNITLVACYADSGVEATSTQAEAEEAYQPSNQDNPSENTWTLSKTADGLSAPATLLLVLLLLAAAVLIKASKERGDGKPFR